MNDVKFRFYGDVFVSGFGGAHIDFIRPDVYGKVREGVIEIYIGYLCRLWRFNFYDLGRDTETFDRDKAIQLANLLVTRRNAYIFARYILLNVHYRDPSYTLAMSGIPFATNDVYDLLDYMYRNYLLDFRRPKMLYHRMSNTMEVLIFEPIRPKYINFILIHGHVNYLHFDEEQIVIRDLNEALSYIILGDQRYVNCRLLL